MDNDIHVPFELLDTDTWHSVKVKNIMSSRGTFLCIWNWKLLKPSVCMHFVFILISSLPKSSHYARLTYSNLHICTTRNNQFVLFILWIKWFSVFPYQRPSVTPNCQKWPKNIWLLVCVVSFPCPLQNKIFITIIMERRKAGSFSSS